MKMWNFSQLDTLPQRALLARLRSVYRVSVMSIRTKPSIPMPWPSRCAAGGSMPDGLREDEVSGRCHDDGDEQGVPEFLVGASGS